jgi:parallel beta-helix repeat protein
MRKQLSRWWYEGRATVDSLCQRLSAHPAQPAYRPKSSNLSSLEPRLLLSATPFDPALLMASSTGESAGPLSTSGGVDLEQPTDVVNECNDACDRSSSTATDFENLRAEINPERSSGSVVVFIDGAVTDLEQLLDDLQTRQPEAEVYVLDSQRDGVDQITEVLSRHDQVEAVHLVSHSNDDSLRLGSAWLDHKSIAGYAGEIASWGNAIDESADLMVYGCDLASTLEGRELLSSLSALTGADVAASSDDTGHARYQADWDFEFTIGNVETSNVFSETLVERWTGKLDVIEVNTVLDVVDSEDGFLSLREAILQAEDGDTILLRAQTYQLTTTGSGPNMSDLDISSDITIIGQGTSTVIDAMSNHRIFDIQDSSSVVIRDLVLTDGQADFGGAIRVQTNSSLTLERVIVQDSSAINQGGGVWNQGNLTISDSRVVNNTSVGEAGGIYSDNWLSVIRSSIETNQSGDEGGGILIAAGEATLHNTTVSGNQAGTRGGGLYNRGTTILTHVTIASNSGISAQGGGIYGESGTVTLDRSIVADNFAVIRNDVAGSGIISGGYNLIEDTGEISGWETTDILNVDPGLSALNDYGGFAHTHAISSESAAIDNAVNSTAVLDARGVSRFQDGDRDTTFVADIGSFEMTTPTDNVITVTNDSDRVDAPFLSVIGLNNNPGFDGGVSLREAILAANARDGFDVIRFDLSASTKHVIEIESSLPAITEAVIIDGTTQPGYAGEPRIFLSGESLLARGIDLEDTAAGSVVRGLGFLDFALSPLLVDADYTTIAGNWSGGFDPVSGETEAGRGNLLNGIAVTSAHNLIGGIETKHANYFGGNGFNGILIQGTGAMGNTILNNRIGVAPNGTDDAPLGGDGILVRAGSGSNLISGNVVGNADHGINLDDSSNNVVIANTVGTNSTNSLDIGNQQHGIRIADDSDNNLIGRFGSENVIVGNGWDGVAVIGNSTGNLIRFNQIVDNGGLPIDLGTDDATANDAQDADWGPNDYQNYPLINAASINGSGNLLLDVEFNSVANETFTIDFYQASAEASSVGDPLRYLGYAIVLTSEDGDFANSFVGDATGIQAGDLIVATATGSASGTSEVSGFVTVGSGNMLPEVDDLETSALSFVEDNLPEVITNSLTVSDGDGDLIQSAVIAIDDFVSGEDALAFNDMLGISGSWNASSGVLTLTGSATAADYQSALRTVTYQNTSDRPATTTRTLRISVSDSFGSSVVESRSLTVVPQDDPPTGQPLIPTNVTEDQTVTVDTSAIDDPDGIASFSFQWFRDGTLINGATSSSYQLDDADVGAEMTVRVSVTDQYGGTAQLTSNSSSAVQNANDTPTGKPEITGTLIEREQLTATLGTVDDADGFPANVDYQWLRDGDPITGATGQTYTLGADDIGERIAVQISYTDLAGTDETVVSESTSVIVEANDPPTLLDNTWNLSFGETLVVGADAFETLTSDPEGDALTATLVAAPANGTLLLQPDGSFVYQPGVQTHGTLTFQWRASDGQLSSNTATVTIEIAPPVINPATPTEPTNNQSGNEQPSEESDSSEASENEESSSESKDVVSLVGVSPNANRTALATFESAATFVFDATNQNSGGEDTFVSTVSRSDDVDASELDRDSLDERVRQLDPLAEFEHNLAASRFDNAEEATSQAIRWGTYARLQAPDELWNELDSNQRRLESIFANENLIVGSFGAATGGFTVIAFTWLRNGFLVLGLWQQRPLWSRMDPLLLMQGFQSDDDESLSDVMESERKRLDEANQTPVFSNTRK